MQDLLLAHVNGQLVPQKDATISIHDKGFIYADGVFDTLRTFDGELFRLEEHVDRLLDSLAYARIEAGLSRSEWMEATEALVEANRPHLPGGEDFWVTQRVTSGLHHFYDPAAEPSPPTIIIDCVPLPLRARAPYFTKGVDMTVANRRRVAPEALSPNAKTLNYMNMMLAQREVAATSPGSWALMCDRNGNLAEGAGCNVFFVKDGVVYTPTTEYVLAGVSRAVVLELCAKLGLELREEDISLFRGATADEAFLTSTSLCAVPVGSLNGRALPNGVPGPVTQRIMTAFAELVGMDYVGQYLRFLGNEPAKIGL
ncbi:MAG: branched-chain-amino-acid transaminase [Rhodospirillales bacterium]